MAGPAIVVDVPLGDGASPQAAAMIDACSRAARAGACALASATREDDQSHARAVAIVAWQDASARVARVEVGLRGAPRGEWRSRTIEFRSEDAPMERWRAVGLVIATLAGEEIAAREEMPAPPPSPPPSPAPALPPAPAPTSAAAASNRVTGGDWQAVLGPALDKGAARVGLAARGMLWPWRSPSFFTFGVRVAGASPTDALSLTWITLGGGPGASTTFASEAIRIAVRGEGIVEWLHAHAADASGARDDASRWHAGLRAGFDAAWMPARALGVVAGAEVSWLPGATTIDLHGVRTGTDPPLQVAGLLGVRTLWR